MKNYVAPKSVVLSMNMNENIAASTEEKHVLNYNNTFYLLNGKIEGIEGLSVTSGQTNYTTMILDWGVALAMQGIFNYQDVLNTCRPTKE